MFGNFFNFANLFEINRLIFLIVYFRVKPVDSILMSNFWIIKTAKNELIIEGLITYYFRR